MGIKGITSCATGKVARHLASRPHGFALLCKTFVVDSMGMYIHIVKEAFARGGEADPSYTVS